MSFSYGAWVVAFIRELVKNLRKFHQHQDLDDAKSKIGPFMMLLKLARGSCNMANGYRQIPNR